MSTKRKNLSAGESLSKLIQGNARFLSGLKSVETLLTRKNITKLATEGQFPFCVVVTSSDSRVPIEYIFDRGLGDVFVIRTFDNGIDSTIAASIEYAVLSFGINLVVVVGHSRLGLVRLTMENETEFSTAESPALQKLVRKGRPLVARARMKEHYFGKIDPGSTEREKIFAQSCELSIATCRQDILRESPLLADKIKKNELALVTALYDMDCGKMNFRYDRKLAIELENSILHSEETRNYAKIIDEIVEKHSRRKKRSTNTG